MGVLEGLAELRRDFRSLRQGAAPQDAWDTYALKVFRFQHRHNPVYRKFCELLGCRDAAAVTNVLQVPHLPVELFARHDVQLAGLPASPSGDCTFRSSGTTGSRPSQHWLDDVSWYREVTLAGADIAFGDLRGYEIFALLPGYLERSDSSLVHMVRDWMQFIQPEANEATVQARFFLRDHNALGQALTAVPSHRKVLIIGVTHALLDWADGLSAPFAQAADWTVLETGGMKGRRQEWVRAAVHADLVSKTGIGQIGSEYGMTEMLSQAYALQGGQFMAPPWLQVRVRETDDPCAWCAPGRQGRICVTDLANLHSCAFLATGDLGRVGMTADGSPIFEVLGRHDHAEIRGCNLMVSDWV